jgi:hypothetical protein
LDNDFKIAAELKRLKETNRHIQQDIDHTTNPITAQNTYDSLNTTLQDKFNRLYNLRDNADEVIADMEDNLISFDEDIDDLIEENNNDDEITPERRRHNNRKIRQLEDDISDADDLIVENEILLNETLKPFNRARERLYYHDYIHPPQQDLIIPPPPMLGNNYDVLNELYGLETDVFLRLAAEKHHNDNYSRQLFGMGLRPYKWKNHWLFGLRKIPIKHRGTPENPVSEDYSDNSPDPFNNPFNDPPPPPPQPPAPFV